MDGIGRRGGGRLRHWRGCSPSAPRGSPARRRYKIHRAIAGSRFVVFETSGHLPFFEEPDAFVAAVEAFLASPSSGGLP